MTLSLSMMLITTFSFLPGCTQVVWMAGSLNRSPWQTGRSELWDEHGQLGSRNGLSTGIGGTWVLQRMSRNTLLSEMVEKLCGFRKENGSPCIFKPHTQPKQSIPVDWLNNQDYQQLLNRYEHFWDSMGAHHGQIKERSTFEYCRTSLMCPRALGWSNTTVFERFICWLASPGGSNSLCARLPYQMLSEHVLGRIILGCSALNSLIHSCFIHHPPKVWHRFDELDNRWQSHHSYVHFFINMARIIL